MQTLVDHAGRRRGERRVVHDRLAEHETGGVSSSATYPVNYTITLTRKKQNRIPIELKVMLRRKLTNFKQLGRENLACVKPKSAENHAIQIIEVCPECRAVHLGLVEHECGGVLRSAMQQ